MKYQDITKYKYRLAEDEVINLPFSYRFPIKNEMITFIDGTLTIKAGYLWDGASGPTIDSKASMLAGLGHDALYELMRRGLLPQGFKEQIDEWFKDTLIENGMWGARAAIWYAGVDRHGGSSSEVQPSTKPDVIEV
jgi:hypothetical protein